MVKRRPKKCTNVYIDKEIVCEPNWDTAFEAEDLYWYCLTKNKDYYDDFEFLKSKVVPIIERSSSFEIISKTPLLMSDPLKGGVLIEDCFDIGSTADCFIDDFKTACASYYGFLFKWRVEPFHYNFESRYLDGKQIVSILRYDSIVPPEFIDLDDSHITFPESLAVNISENQFTIKQVVNRLDGIKDEFLASFGDGLTKMGKNKSLSIEVVQRSIISFDYLLKYQYENQKEFMDYKSFIFHKIFLAYSYKAEEVFDYRSNNRIWPEKTEEVYQKYGYVCRDHADFGKLRSKRGKEFEISLRMINNPTYLLSVFTNF